MTKVMLMGVTQLTDSYPNVTYKLALLKSLDTLVCMDNIYRIDRRTSFGRAAKHAPLKRIAYSVRFLWGHLAVVMRYAASPARLVYIPYPGIVLAAIFSLFPRRTRPKIMLDAFISIYDTVVNDRAILARRHWLAKLLYRLERRAFSASHRILVDTTENAGFYSELFNIPIDHFVEIPLSIPALRTGERTTHTDKFVCAFVGTFVPLHGTRILLDAARRLQDQPDVKIVVVGDGQDAPRFEALLKEYQLTNIEWHRGHYATDYVTEIIAGADVCLGIFGTSDKAQRVLPYKLYYYLAMGRPIITAETRCITRFSALQPETPFECVPAGDDAALANAIRHLRNHPERCRALSSASRNFFEARLGERVVAAQLLHLINQMAET